MEEDGFVNIDTDIIKKLCGKWDETQVLLPLDNKGSSETKIKDDLLRKRNEGVWKTMTMGARPSNKMVVVPTRKKRTIVEDHEDESRFSSIMSKERKR